MPRVRMSIFSRLFHMEYICRKREFMERMKEIRGPLLNPNFRLSVKNATSVQKKPESLSPYLLVRAL